MFKNIFLCSKIYIYVQKIYIYVQQNIYLCSKIYIQSQKYIFISTHSKFIARVITNTSKYQHSTLNTQNTTLAVWLPIKQRIDYKICLLTYETLTHQQPRYLYNIVFHFRHIVFLHDLLIHLFFPFHMSDHHLANGLSLSSRGMFGKWHRCRRTRRWPCATSESPPQFLFQLSCRTITCWIGTLFQRFP